MGKRISIVLAVVLFCSCRTGGGSAGFNDNPVIAHRGAWKNTGHPQNSLASLWAAVELGCRGSELDVHLTVDDSLVVNHDLDHFGLTIDSTAYAELVRIPLANGEKLPTLREYLQEGMKQERTKLILDIKTPAANVRAEQVARHAHRLVEELGAGNWVEYLVSDLAAEKALLGLTDSPVAYLGRYGRQIEEMEPANVLARGSRCVDYRYIYFRNNPGWIDDFRNADVHLNAWTVNAGEDMDWFLERGFDYITTDEPELLMEKVNNLKQ